MKVRIVSQDNINQKLFDKFNRYQAVKKCWRKESGNWVLKDVWFIEQWEQPEYQYLVQCLKNTVNTGGRVYGAFENDVLVGFCSVESNLFGSKQEYVQLSSLHVTCDRRGDGIGRVLFQSACDAGIQLGAKKLYISSHSAEETQSFYKSVGCIEAIEYNSELVEKEPCDCQLEYVLD